MSERTSVLVVDDHPVVREGLSTFLATHPDLELVGTAADGQDAVERTQESLPDVVLLDLVMPNVDGLEAIRRIRAISPETKVIVLTSFPDDERLFAAVKAGAAGYLLKDAEPSEIVEAIRTVRRGGALLHPAAAARLMQEFAGPSSDPILGRLTDREVEVLRLVAVGRSNREIAAELFLSEKTVKTHISNILAKLHVADRTQAALVALRRRLVDIDDLPGVADA